MAHSDHYARRILLRLSLCPEVTQGAKIMNSKKAIRSQYQAVLEMLKQTITRCPANLWDNPSDKNKFWHIAYHVLFFTHLYLQDTEKEFRPWSKHREHYQFLGTLPWSPHDKPKIGEAYHPEEVLAYLEVCQAQVNEKVAALDLAAETSGFSWLPFGKLELQLYNIRHLQQHTGELMERLGTRENIEVDWIGMKSDG
jgi:hypothetical protein